VLKDRELIAFNGSSALRPFSQWTMVYVYSKVHAKLVEITPGRGGGWEGGCRIIESCRRWMFSLLWPLDIRDRVICPMDNIIRKH